MKFKRKRGRPAPEWFNNILRLRNRYYSTSELEMILGASARTIAGRFKIRGVRSRPGNGSERLKTYWNGKDIKDIAEDNYNQPALF